MGARKNPARSKPRTKRGIQAVTPSRVYAANVTSAPITPGVLQWARARRSMTLIDLQKKLRVSADEIGAWERGTAQPEYAKAQRLARALRIPFGFLFLPSRPADDMPLPDLRTRKDQRPDAPSTELLEVVNDALRRQEWYREYAEENGTSPLSFVRKYGISAGASAVAENMRDVLHVTEATRRGCNSLESYLTQLTRNAESAGILVMRSGVVKHDTSRLLTADEFQGFALCDDLAPVIFINLQDVPAARIFTFAHEAAHLWIGASGISSPGWITEDISATDTQRVERFCHSVAAELLVPRSELLEMWPPDSMGQVLTLASEFARHFWVSRIVVLRRAFELDLIERSEFFAAIQQIGRPQKPPRRTESGGNPWNTVPARNSVRFTDSVLAALRERRLLHTDAATLLAVSQPFLLRLASKRMVA